MKLQVLEYLLIVMMTLLLGISFHAARLWLKVREVNRSARFVVIQPIPIPQETESEAGCTSFLLWFFIIILVISIVALYG